MIQLELLKPLPLKPQDRNFLSQKGKRNYLKRVGQDIHSVETGEINSESSATKNGEKPAESAAETDSVAAKNTGVDKATTKKIIAICAPTRSKPDWQFVDGTALQNLLVKSLTKTVTEADRSEYDFRLYLAADHNDKF